MEKYTSKNGTRKYTTFSVLGTNLELLQEMNNTTGIPKSKLIDRAIELLYKNYKDNEEVIKF